jgi:hypothetical protein
LPSSLIFGSVNHLVRNLPEAAIPGKKTRFRELLLLHVQSGSIKGNPFSVSNSIRSCSRFIRAVSRSHRGIGKRRSAIPVEIDWPCLTLHIMIEQVGRGTGISAWRIARPQSISLAWPSACWQSRCQDAPPINLPPSAYWRRQEETSGKQRFKFPQPTMEIDYFAQ